MSYPKQRTTDSPKPNPFAKLFVPGSKAPSPGGPSCSTKMASSSPPTEDQDVATQPWLGDVDSLELDPFARLLHQANQAEVLSVVWADSRYPATYPSANGEPNQGQRDAPFPPPNDDAAPRYDYDYSSIPFAGQQTFEGMGLLSPAENGNGTVHATQYQHQGTYVYDYAQAEAAYNAGLPQPTAPFQHPQHLIDAANAHDHLNNSNATQTHLTNGNNVQEREWTEEDILKLYKLKTITKKGIKFILERFPGETKDTIAWAWKTYKDEGKRLLNEQREL
ncbi:hypothetical protein IQ07DRAFT_641379 [Pyrenochaeta sp. DS3sAY3a]|nr:hypothetical protein IQ07DRAFT_641379 [Pyrenochaeta sp. DS3sAY3a]